MIITKEHLIYIEKTVGYNCVAGITFSPTIEGAKILVVVKHPHDHTEFKVQRSIPHTLGAQHLTLEIEYFAADTKRAVDQKFGVVNTSGHGLPLTKDVEP